jgi:glutamate---cysteine ligase / carboxylate-amine ligase
VNPDTADRLRRRFDETGGLTVGVEEEVMLLDPETLDLTPRVDDLMARVGHDRRFTAELPAAQIEILTGPSSRASDVVAELATARRDLHRAADGLATLAVAGTHPFASELGVLNAAPRYAGLLDRYASVARRQLVAGLQIHVAIGGADRSLAVYNALRCLLPEILALAANAPFHGGSDSGLATVRPLIATQLPRQGLPPFLESWEQFAAELSWGARAGTVTDVTQWWWELRPHPRHGTLELRVPDAQTSLPAAAGITAFVQALCAWLAEGVDAGEPILHPPLWRIAENRWSAIRHGLDGSLADLDSGEPQPTRARVAALIEQVRPQAARLGSEALLDHARALLIEGGAVTQRAIARERDLRGLVEWMSDQFLARS